VPYTTSKAAIVHLTQDLAAQWAEKGIRVNAIAPGQVESGMTYTLTESYRQGVINSILLGRIGNPVEVAGVLAALASDAGSFHHRPDVFSSTVVKCWLSVLRLGDGDLHGRTRSAGFLR
jgi:NAD(P)-dependent dehydrogenase (short-subunit alcohol dehydrogenase family)